MILDGDDRSWGVLCPDPFCSPSSGSVFRKLRDLGFKAQSTNRMVHGDHRPFRVLLLSRMVEGGWIHVQSMGWGWRWLRSWIPYGQTFGRELPLGKFYKAKRGKIKLEGLISRSLCSLWTLITSSHNLIRWQKSTQCCLTKKKSQSSKTMETRSHHPEWK